MAHFRFLPFIPRMYAIQAFVPGFGLRPREAERDEGRLARRDDGRLPVVRLRRRRRVPEDRRAPT